MKKSFLLTFFATSIVFASAQLSFSPTTLMHDLKILSSDSLEGRKTGTTGNEKARSYITTRLHKSGVKPFVSGYTQSFPIVKSGLPQKEHGVNIVSVIPGKKKATIVISAHYDHIGISNDAIYNGADDNASGTSALLTIAEYFKKVQPDHRLVFAFFDAEEQGLKGSAYFVNSLDLQKENIVLDINLDMVSRSDKNELYACGTFLYPQLKEKLEKTKIPDGIKILFGHDDPMLKRNDWTSQSDHYNFHLKKIPFLYFGVEDHADYHRTTDTFEKINPDFYANSVETILQAVIALDKSLQ